MGDVYFSTNPSDYGKLPGLYISERNPAGFIQGRDLSRTGFAGKCVRGPLDSQIISSPGRFVDIFGERDYGSGGTLVGQVWLALVNKPFGANFVVRRVAAADAVKASFTWEDTAGGGGAQVLRVDASSVGLWGNNVSFKISAASSGVAGQFNITIRYLGKETLYQDCDTSTGVDNLALKVGTDAARFVDLVKVASGRPSNTSASTDGADADAFVALGQTGVSGYTGVAGSEGTLAVTDYNTATNDLAVYPGISVVLTPEIVTGSAATYHSNLVTLAASVSDRIFLTWAQAHGQAVATEAAQVTSQITTRSDRIVWAFNSPWTIDPKTSGEVQTAPHVWLASILSQVDIDIHAGAAECVAFAAGATRVTNTALQRGDLILLKNAGISTIERNTEGFQFRDVLTTSLTAGKTELSRRRMADFLQLSASDSLRFYVKRKNTLKTRAGMAGELTAFSDSLRDAERVVEEYELDSDSVNTPGQREVGEEHILWRVKLIGHILALVLETEIATGTVIERE